MSPLRSHVAPTFTSLCPRGIPAEPGTRRGRASQGSPGDGAGPALRRTRGTWGFKAQELLQLKTRLGSVSLGRHIRIKISVRHPHGNTTAARTL